MCTSFKLKSHPHQPLFDHLTGVTNIALKLCDDSNLKNDEIRDITYKICMAHDFGKATSYFQKYINNPCKENDVIEKSHALISAMFAYWWLPKKYKYIGYLVIKRHHGNIYNSVDETIDKDDIDLLKLQVNDLKNCKNELEKIYGFNLDNFFEFITNFFEDEDEQEEFFDLFGSLQSIEDMIVLDELYSYLLSADKLQLIGVSIDLPKIQDESIIENYKNKTREELLSKNSDLINSRIFNIREEIFEELKNELNKVDLKNESFFSINVPTGSGKTFLCYYAALFMSSRIQNSRIIYSLPFTSIIDQNYDILSDIFNLSETKNDRILIKHHSLTEPDIPDDDNYDVFKMINSRFINENWNSKIITTTFVQVCNTIFKAGNKNIMHRFRTFQNAIVIFDEIQILPEKLLKALFILMELIAKKYNTKFIFVTATMPIIIDSHELIPSKEKYFRELNRIKIINHSDTETHIVDFLNILESDILNRPEKSFLIVMNTINSSKLVYKYLKSRINDKKIFNLTTEIYPKARLEKIKYIKELMKNGEKPILVSTQLIEAGVDVDFDIVYRDLAPLTSINQTAGRANRNGINTLGEVHIYNLTDGKSYHTIYPNFIINITQDLLKDKKEIFENEIYDLNKEFAKKLSNATNIEISEKILEDAKRFNFNEIRLNTNIIPKQFKYDFYINANEESNKILKDLEIARLKQNKIKYNLLLKKLNSYKVSLFENKYENIEENIKETSGIKWYPIIENNIQLYSEEEGFLEISSPLTF